MKKIAVICELNPPHSGHEKLVEEVRKTYSDCAVIAVMSGTFVQRGEPAIYPKHVRAAAALDIGFDLVIELPAAL
ncbi:MAG: nucleotidyltransferase family protein, partial [Oscillospiraceae bacterium]|nr:nucleotidyltransferase family protein [Oscillospiraceae bacterium]